MRNTHNIKQKVFWLKLPDKELTEWQDKARKAGYYTLQDYVKSIMNNNNIIEQAKLSVKQDYDVKIDELKNQNEKLKLQTDTLILVLNRYQKLTPNIKVEIEKINEKIIESGFTLEQWDRMCEEEMERDNENKILDKEWDKKTAKEEVGTIEDELKTKEDELKKHLNDRERVESHIKKITNGKVILESNPHLQTLRRILYNFYKDGKHLRYKERLDFPFIIHKLVYDAFNDFIRGSGEPEVTYKKFSSYIQLGIGFREGINYKQVFIKELNRPVWCLIFTDDIVKAITP